MASYDNKVLTGDQLVTLVGKIKSALAAKQDALTFNTAYNASTNKAATMADIPDVSGKQDALVFNTAYNASTNKVATMSDIPDTSSFLTSSDLSGYAETSDIPDVSDFVTADDIIDSITAQVDGEVESESIGDAIQQLISQNTSGISSGLTEDNVLSILNAVLAGPYNTPEPAAPDEGEYTTEEEDPETGEMTEVFDQEGYDAAVAQYENDLVNYSLTEEYDDILERLAQIIAGEVPGALAFNTTYNATSNQVATMADVSGKQDALVFNTAYNASSNKVATMADIPSVSGFQTASDVNTAITTALSGITSFSFQIVQTLPSSDISTSTIYLVLKSSGSTGNVYTEYAYINSNWEILGDTQADISTLSTTDVNTIWTNTSAL